MSFDPASLPREPDQLIEMVLSLQGENDKLRAIVATLKRALFGARSERLDASAAQLPLGLGDLAAIPVEPEPTPKPQPADRPTRPQAVRNIGGLPKHLPREEIVIAPEAQACPCCQGKLHPIGEDVSEMLDVIPAVIRVRRIRRPRYGCRACESAVVQAPAPPRLVEGGMATTALVTHVVVSKFAWHLPLHRQVQMLEAHGIDLDRSTLVHWVARAAWWLKPLHELLVATVLSAPKVFCDDTPLPVLDGPASGRGSRGSGPTQPTTGRGRGLRRQRSSTCSPRIARVVMSPNTSPGSAASCRSTLMPAILSSPGPIGPAERSSWPIASPMPAGGSSTSTRRQPRR